MNKLPILSIIGLGKLGSCMAATYAGKGFKIIGVDINPEYVAKINKSIPPVQETDLAKYIKKARQNLTATTDTQKAVLESDITFIIVPTPTDKTGGFSTKFAQSACREIGKALAKKSTYHLVVMTSTVLPTDSAKDIIPTLEKYSGKICGKDFGYCYSPEFIAIGSVIHDLLYPDFYLVGEFDSKSGNMLEKLYPQLCSNNAPVSRMNIVSAELAKISLNAYVTSKIVFANMLTDICQHIPNANVDKITDAIGQDKRIGKYYLRGGLGFGGPCFPRDNVAFAYMASKFGTEAPVAKTTHRYNEAMVDKIVNLVVSNCHKKQVVGMLGLSYKPGTPVTEESHVIKITKKLLELNYQIIVYEPAGYQFAKQDFGDSVQYAKDLNEAITKSDVLFIGYIDEEFELLNKYIAKKIIIDPWRFLKSQINRSSKYIPYGIGK